MMELWISTVVVKLWISVIIIDINNLINDACPYLNYGYICNCIIGNISEDLMV